MAKRRAIYKGSCANYDVVLENYTIKRGREGKALKEGEQIQWKRQ